MSLAPAAKKVVEVLVGALAAVAVLVGLFWAYCEWPRTRQRRGGRKGLVSDLLASVVGSRAGPSSVCARVARRGRSARQRFWAVRENAERREAAPSWHRCEPDRGALGFGAGLGWSGAGAWLEDAQVKGWGQRRWVSRQGTSSSDLGGTRHETSFSDVGSVVGSLLLDRYRFRRSAPGKESWYPNIRVVALRLSIASLVCGRRRALGVKNGGAYRCCVPGAGGGAPHHIDGL